MEANLLVTGSRGGFVQLELLRRGQGSKLAELTPEAIQQSGDHELLNWIIALGLIDNKPAQIVNVRESHTQNGSPADCSDIAELTVF